MTSVEALAAVPFVDGIVYGEGPRWHGDRLWFTDGLAGRVYSAGAAGDLAVEVELARASGLGWLPDGTLVVSTLFSAELHHADAHGNVTAGYDLSDIAWSTNDLLVAPDGRTYLDLYIADGRGLTGGIDRTGRPRRRRAHCRHRTFDAQRPRTAARRIDPGGQRDTRFPPVGVHRRSRRQPGNTDRVRRPGPGPAS